MRHNAGSEQTRVIGTDAERRARLRAIDAEREVLWRQEADAFVAIIAHDDEVQREHGTFSSVSLWARQAVNLDLRDALAFAGIRSPQQLGNALRRLHRHPHGPWSLTRVGGNNQGAIWSVNVIDDVHLGACSLPTTGA